MRAKTREKGTLVPSIVYQTDKRSGSTYAYRSTSYRDPETGRPRSKREYLGRVDPATGEIVPKAAAGRRNRSKVGELPAEPSLADKMKDRDDELEALRTEVVSLRQRVAELEAALGGVARTAVDALGEAWSS